MSTTSNNKVNSGVNSEGSTQFNLGLIQMNSTDCMAENCELIEQGCKELKEKGCSLVVTPENALLFSTTQAYHTQAEPLDVGPMQQRLAAIAKLNQIWLLIGSFPVRRDQVVTTTSLLFDPDGKLVADYDKLHMFDVDVEDGHGSYRESETFQAGNRVVTHSTPFANLGLTICYDLRFPHLFNQLRANGANVILVPAAFTAHTGKAHWRTLLQARAIETQCWVIGVNQTGTHSKDKQTWGHSLVISPWGDIIKECGGQPGNYVATVDMSLVDPIRRAMPIESHAVFQNQRKSQE